MAKMIACLERIQAAALNSDDRGRRVGADVSLDFFASTSSASKRVTVWLAFVIFLFQSFNKI